MPQELRNRKKQNKIIKKIAAWVVFWDDDAEVYVSRWAGGLSGRIAINTNHDVRMRDERYRPLQKYYQQKLEYAPDEAKRH
ncbi:hypothetical protein BDN70DRAFT_886528 [Pholiota conissans]|uniref:Uncharacterized protein n=1 Tax=Pholiota conissans TaxID=109636 RepID=A0A9P5YQG1_9AGAR|nr:hypothetical protein BDN70DRAFT_886528 [Pholiota conissans]